MSTKRIAGKYLSISALLLVSSLPATAQWSSPVPGAVHTTNSGANVGIGTTAPAAKLHVAGAPASMLFQHTTAPASSGSVAGIVSFTDSAGAEYAWFGDGSSSSNSMTLFAVAEID